MKKKIKFDPFKDLVLDKYEQEIEDALEKGEFVSDPNFEKTKKLVEEAARNYSALKSSKRITIRLKQEDLIQLKLKAKQNMIPYQTLIGLLVHKYAKGETQVVL